MILAVLLWHSTQGKVHKGSKILKAICGKNLLKTKAKHLECTCRLSGQAWDGASRHSQGTSDTWTDSPHTAPTDRICAHAGEGWGPQVMNLEQERLHQKQVGCSQDHLVVQEQLGCSQDHLGCSQEELGWRSQGCSWAAVVPLLRILLPFLVLCHQQADGDVILAARTSATEESDGSPWPGVRPVLACQAASKMLRLSWIALAHSLLNSSSCFCLFAFLSSLQSSWALLAICNWTSTLVRIALRHRPESCPSAWQW